MLTQKKILVVTKPLPTSGFKIYHVTHDLPFTFLRHECTKNRCCRYSKRQHREDQCRLFDLFQHFSDISIHTDASFLDFTRTKCFPIIYTGIDCFLIVHGHLPEFSVKCFFPPFILLQAPIACITDQLHLILVNIHLRVHVVHGLHVQVSHGNVCLPFSYGAIYFRRFL